MCFYAAMLLCRWMMPSCITKCLSELTHKSPQDYTIPDVNAAVALVRPHSATHQLFFDTVVSLAVERLLELLGDAEAVCQAWYDGTSILGQQLLELSLPSVLVLLSSDSLSAWSENNVLMMATKWITYAPAGVSSTPEQRRQVASTLRLSQLTPTYLYELLPQLPWLAITQQELASLMNRTGAIQGSYMRRAQRQAHLLQAGRTPHDPLTWFSSEPRMSAQSARVTSCSYSKEQLVAMEQGACSTKPRPIDCCNGFGVHPLVFTRGDPRSGTTASGVQRRVWQAGLVFSAQPGHTRLKFAALDCSVQCMIQRKDGVWASCFVEEFVQSSVKHAITLLRDLACEPGAAAQDWDPYLVDGRLRICYFFTRCE